MSYTYVHPVSDAYSNILLEPDRPVTQMQLYNTIAEMNTGGPNEVLMPAWAYWMALGILVALVAIAIALIVIAASRLRGGAGPEEAPEEIAEGDEYYCANCGELVGRHTRRCPTCGSELTYEDD